MAMVAKISHFYGFCTFEIDDQPGLQAPRRAI